MLSLQAGALTQRDPSNSPGSRGWSDRARATPVLRVPSLASRMGRKGKVSPSSVCTNISEGETGEGKGNLENAGPSF